MVLREVHGKYCYAKIIIELRVTATTEDKQYGWKPNSTGFWQ